MAGRRRPAIGGPRDAKVHRVLTRVTKLPVSPTVGQRAGELLGVTGLAQSTVNALVAATALDQLGPVMVLTSDPDDLRSLTASRRDLSVQPV